MKRGLVVVGLLAAFALGWFLHHPQVSITPPAITTSPQTVAVRALAELLGYYQRKDMELTARNRVLVDSLRDYKRLSDEQLHIQQRAETTFTAAVRDTMVSRDSLGKLCSVVVMACEQRARAAEEQRDRYAKALDAQLGLQPHRWSISLTGGATKIFFPKPAAGLGATLGASFRLW